MQQLVGNRIDAGLFPGIEPHEVLYDFDGPRTFTCFDAKGGLCLAHWSDEDRRAIRYLVVPVTESSIQKLKTGEMSLREALDHPRLSLVEVMHTGEVIDAWQVKMDDLPEDAVPRPGTLLWPSLESRLVLHPRSDAIPPGPIPETLRTASS